MAATSAGLGGLLNSVVNSGPLEAFAQVHATLMLAVSFLIVFSLPNTLEIFGVSRSGKLTRTRLGMGRAIMVGLLSAVCLVRMVSSTANEFIYFAF